VTPLPHTINEEPASAGSDFIDLHLALSDLRRGTDATPADAAAGVFAAGAKDIVSAWYDRMLKPDLVDALYAVGVAAGLTADSIQNGLADAYRQVGGAT